MKYTICMCLLSAATLFICPVVRATLITSEDFEGGAIGWSDNKTQWPIAPFTKFLGKHGDASSEVTKTYTLSGAHTQVMIQFDFYELDSWDDHDFIVTVDGGQIWKSTHNFLVLENPGGNTANETFLSNLGFSFWFDQTYTISLTVPHVASTLTIGFDATLDANPCNEAWGVDNLTITDNGIPEPGTLGLLLVAMLSLRFVFRTLPIG